MVTMIDRLQEEALEKSTKEVNNFFSLLSSESELTFFSYLRIYNDGKIERFCNHYQWTKNYYSQKIYNQDRFYKNYIEKSSEYQDKFFLWCAEGDKLVYKKFYDYDIGNGISNYRKYSNFIETYSLGTNLKNKDAYSFYFNKLDHIKNFVSIFKQEFFNSSIDPVNKINSILRPKNY